MRDMRRNRHCPWKQYRSNQNPDKREVTPLQRVGTGISCNDVLWAIEQWVIGRNGERDRIIMRMYMVDGITFARMQERLDSLGYELSIDQIKKIVRRRKEEVFRHI